MLLVTIVAALARCRSGYRRRAPPGSDCADLVAARHAGASASALPFFAVAATAPLLQRWFCAARPDGIRISFTRRATSAAWSGCSGYPLLVEPTLGAHDAAPDLDAAASSRSRCSSPLARAMSLARAGPAPRRGVDAPLTSRRRRRAVARPRLVARPGARAVEPADRRDDPHLHRRRRRAAAVGGAAGALPHYLHRRLRRRGRRAPAAGSRVWRRLAIVAALAGLVIGTSWSVGLAVHLIAFALSSLAPSTASSPSGGPAPRAHGLLPAGLGRRRARRHPQCAGRAGGLLRDRRVPADAGGGGGAAAGARLARRACRAASGGVGLPLVVFAVVTAVWSTGLVAGADIGANTPPSGSSPRRC